MCLANDIRPVDAVDALRPVKGPDGTVGPPVSKKTPTVRQISVSTTISGGEFSAISGVTDERTKVKELLRNRRIMPAMVILDPAVTRHRVALAVNWCARRRPLRRRHLLGQSACLWRCAGA
jgi:maleylacetate reductase